MNRRKKGFEAAFEWRFFYIVCTKTIARAKRLMKINDEITQFFSLFSSRYRFMEFNKNL